jgi:putative sigma-54 modulation protein
MQIQIHSRNVRVDDRLQDYVEKRLTKLDKYLPGIADVKVDLAQERQKKGGERVIAQVTVRDSKGTILRAEEKNQSELTTAVDMVVDKIYRQITRYKGKQRRRSGERFEVLEPEFASAEMPPVGGDHEEDDLAGILRRKRLELVPMSEDEALDQMELLDHDFFVFCNANTGQVNVLYRRENGGFGVLEPHVS